MAMDDIHKLLDGMLSSTSIGFEVRGNQILLTKKVPMSLTVKVLDANSKEPIAGATILIKGTSNGGISDGKGNAIIKNVYAGNEIEVSFIGLKSKTIKVTNTTKNCVVSLEQDAIRLDEVIVTGYQKISKERSTGSFATVTAKSMEAKLNPNVKTLLEGQVAGLSLNRNGELEIRGVATLNAERKPLIVLDGFPYEGTLESINANNIENITVLKDGVAASIYGARSANGVIVITSKSGKKDSFKISYKGTMSIASKAREEDLLRGSTSDNIDFKIANFNANPSYASYGVYDDVTRILVDTYRFSADKKNVDYTEAYRKIDAYRTIDGFGDIYKYAQRNPISHDHNLNLNGGGNKNSYNVSLNFLDNYNATPDKNNNAFSVDIKNDWTPTKWLTFNIIAAMNYATNEGPANNWEVLCTDPYRQLFDENGKSINVTSPIDDENREKFASRKNMHDMSYNPYDDMFLNTVSGNTLGIRAGGNITITLAKGLTLTGGGMWSKSKTNEKGIQDGESFYVRWYVNRMTDATNSAKKYLPNGDIVDESLNEASNWTLRSQLNFNRDFKDGKHRITALGGIEVRSVQSYRNSFDTRVGYNKISGQYVPMDIVSFNAGLNKPKMVDNYASFTLKQGSIGFTENRFASYYGNASYEFNNKYIASGSIRLDQTNFFGTDPKYRNKPLWSVGATWKLSEESFFNVELIDRLNLRASYGINGNISLEQGPFLILTSGDYNEAAGGMTNGISSLPNQQLRWEKTKTTNVGFDFSMFNSRLNLNFDYYVKNSSDLLANDAIDPTTGFSSLMKNVGAIKNSGIEITLGGLIVNKAVRWNSSLNVAYNKNEVIRYNVNRKYISDWTNTYGIILEEYGMGSLFSFKFAGLDKDGRTQVYNKDGEKKGISAINDKDDLVYSGTTVPPVSLSFSNTITYKNLQLDFMFTGKFGAKYRCDGFFGSNGNSRFFNQRWQKAGDENHTVYPAFAYSSSDNGRNPNSDIFIKSADFIKLKTLSLSYGLPKQLLNKTFFTDIRVSFQARNLFTIAAKGVKIDPETYQIAPRPEYFIGLSLNF